MQSAAARGLSNATLRLTVRKVKPTSGTVLLISVVVLLIGSMPGWPYSDGWGYSPSAVLALVLLSLIVLWLMGRI